MSGPGGISIHVVDISRGLPAKGMIVSLSYLRDGNEVVHLLNTESLDRNGVISIANVHGSKAAAGIYTATFHIADYYRLQGLQLPEIPFIDVMPFIFSVAETSRHYHLPVKCTPWGLSLFLTK